jgi:hypothetical protein
MRETRRHRAERSWALQNRLRLSLLSAIHHHAMNLMIFSAGFAAVQQEIWTTLMRAVKSETSLPLAQMLLPPANEVFDLTTTRLLTARQHPPLAVYLMLAVLVLMSAMMAGYGMAKSEPLSTLHLVGFAAILSFSVYLILDIEHPRLGLVTIESFDQAIVDLRKSMD